MELIPKPLPSRPRTIAVDVDGCLSEYTGWQGFFHLGPPIAPVVEAVCKEKANGTRIVIHTCRVTTFDNKVHFEAVKFLECWLRGNGIPYDEIWLGVGKPSAEEYWDDKAVKKP